MKKILFAFCFCLSVDCTLANDFDPDFFCSGAEDLVEKIEEGVDNVVEEFFTDTEFFVEYTVIGWQCAPEPLPPIKNGRNFLEKIQCFTSNDDRRVTSQDLREAGEIFQQNIPEIYECFGDNILNEAFPSANENGRLQAERMNILLSDNWLGNNIVFEYGYFRSEETRSPIIWEMAVGFATK